jgi:predicted nuclease of restriction endonuclease-like (RecB) superfamily
MKKLTESEANQWMTSLGLPPTKSYIQNRWNAPNGLQYNIRDKEALRQGLAICISGFLFESEVLLVIFEHGIWSSSEIPYLWHLVQRDGGVPEEIDYVSYVLGAEEDERLFSILFLMLNFGWGFMVVGKEKQLSFIHDHDDGLVAICDNHETLGYVKDRFDAFGFRQYT